MYCDWPQLGRCCFCMPLRRGVLTFGYIHMFFSAFMIGMYSYSVEYAEMTEWLMYGRALILPAELCVAFYCFELIFDGLLIYGAHKKALMYLKVFYYYTITTCVAMLIMQILDVVKMDRMFLGNAIEMCTFAFAGLCLITLTSLYCVPNAVTVILAGRFVCGGVVIAVWCYSRLQIYLLTMVWSLIKKLEISGPHVYDNQLHQIVSGEPKVDSNGIYNTTTVGPITDV